MAVSIIDVAKSAGVSLATVSRVLSGNPRVQAENVKAVMAAVKELGYTAPIRKRGPKPGSGRRSRRKVKKILLVVPSRSGDRRGGSVFLDSPFGQEVTSGIVRVADDHGVDVEVTPVVPGEAVDALGGDGLIVACPLGTSSGMLSIADSTVPQVVLSQRSPYRPSCDCVAVNDYMGGELTVDELLSLGCSRAAVVTSVPEDAQPLERLYGFRRTAKLRDMPAYYVGPITYHAEGPDRPAVIDGSPKVLVDQLFSLPQVPDGLALAVPSVKAVYDELRGRGIEPVRENPRPGKSVVVITSATVSLRNNPVDPRPHLVSYSGMAAGQRLMEQLLRRIAYPDDPVTHFLIAPEMIR